MDRQTSNIQSRSVYSLGAYDGVWIGLAMGLCMVCMIESARFPFLSLVALVLLIGVPIAVWKFLRRAWVKCEVPPTFSAVWLHGICIFLFGGLIMALMTYAALKYLSPNWIENQTRLAAMQLAADPSTAPQAKILLNIADSGQLPSPIYTSVSAIWLIAFTGSLWSMLFAFFLTRTARFRKMRQS